MTRFRVLVADDLGTAGLERAASAGDADFDLAVEFSREKLLASLPGYEGLIVRSRTTVDRELIESGPDLRIVGRAGVGVDNIDVDAATERGVIVMNTPEANTVAVAEHTVALMLAASRHIVRAHETLRAGRWERREFLGIQLEGKVVGIIGFGRTGRSVARRCLGFGMEVLAYDPYVSEDVAREFGVDLVNLDELLERADFISLHALLTDETRHLINAEALSRMKDGVVLINAARGGLVDEHALADAIRQGKVGTAAVDVYSTEPPGADHPLIGLDNVLHTPHLGATTREAQRDVAIQIVDQVLEALRGRDFRNAVNMPFPAWPDFQEVLPYMSLAERMGALQFVMAPAPIKSIEVEVRGEHVERMIRHVASALLKGVLQRFLAHTVNYVNAPTLAAEHGIATSQMRGLGATRDYPNLISCRVHWDGGSRLMAGVLFAGGEPRIVEVDRYHIDAEPKGVMLLMVNDDVPGVVGAVGTLLGAAGVNIGEWRLGRDEERAEALSFVNLDSEPPGSILEELGRVPGVKTAVIADL